jgi:hypothetical protein
MSLHQSYYDVRPVLEILGQLNQENQNLSGNCVFEPNEKLSLQTKFMAEEGL